MSAGAQSVFGKSIAGSRRATPSTESTAGSPVRACSTLVPTFPLAPTTTTLMKARLPESSFEKLRAQRCIPEPGAQFRHRLEHRHRTRLLELGTREAAGDD